MSGFCQINYSSAFPTPNNSFLGAAGLRSNSVVDVDLYTGAAEVNIPITTLASKELSIPISLNYTGGRGIRVQDYATFVGLGWQLNAGGSISRVVRGFPDEFPNGYLGNGTSPSGAIGTGGQWGKVVNNYFNGTNWTSSQSSAIMGSNYGLNPPAADGEPDLFYVKTPFFSFQFTFDQYGNPVFSNNLGYKIYTTNFFNSGNYTNCSFEVVDPQGNMYYFGNTANSVELTTTKLYGTSYQFPSTWYLTSINTYNTRDNITFSYTNSATSTPDTTYHYYGTYALSVYGVPSYDTTHPSMSIVSPPRYVSSIVTSLGEADFNYLFDRMDDIHAGRLVSISTKAYNPQTLSNNTAMQTYNFNYDYFGSPSTDPNQLRLRLNNISVTGNTNATSLPLTLNSFTYYNAYSPMGSRKDFGISDYWGYLNFMIPMTYYPFPNNSRLPNGNAAQTYALNTITDLVGKTWNIYYSLNDYYQTSSSSTVSVGGLRVTNISQTLPTGESLAKTFTYTINSGQSSGEILTNNYNIIGFTGAFYNNGNLSVQVFSEDPSDVTDLNGNFCGYSQVKVTEPNGGYSISTFSNFNDNGNFQDVLNYYSISNGTTVTQVPDITSSSSRAYKRSLLTDKTIFTSTGSKVSEDNIPITNYYSLTSPVSNQSWGYKWNTFSFSVNGASGSNSCYSYYTTFVENFRPGNIIHTDYDQKSPTTSYLISNTALTYSPINKMLLKTSATTDSKSGAYSKTYYYPDETTAIPLSSSEQVAITAMVNGNKIATPIHEEDSRNGVVTKVHQTLTTGTNSYNNGYPNTYLTTLTTYNGALTARQQTINYNQSSSNPSSSNLAGGKSSSVYYDYNFSYPVAKIENANSSYTQQNSTSGFGGNFTTSSSYPIVTAYTGAIAFTIYDQGSLNGATLTIHWSVIGPSNSSGTGTISSQGGYFSQNLSSMAAGSYTVTFSISSSNGTYPSLYCSGSYPSVINTFTNEFYYEGFEQSGWGTNVTNGAAHTGNYYFSGASYYLPFVLPNSRSYLLQYYSLISGQWTLNEVSYTGPQYISGPIDDVRVFPSDALMTTFTYNPLVGKTSETDPSGKSIIYQYDGLNRLQTVRDQNNNILKQYDYEYQSCVQTVHNTAQSGYFVKQGCPITTGVQYVVPAGKYSACTAGAAFSLAINDLIYNGQNYANAQTACGPVLSCPAPTTVTVSSINSYGFTIAWNSPTGVGTNAYAVFVTNLATGVQVSDNYGASSPEVLSNLQPNTSYAIQIESLCTGNPVSAPVVVSTTAAVSQAVNLLNASSPPSGFCCHGCQYTGSVYPNTATIAAGTLLYTDQALTQPLTGYNWIFPYINNSANVAFQISGNTVTSTTNACH